MTTFISFTSINVPGIPVTDIYTSADGIDAAEDVVGNYGDAVDAIFHGFVYSGGVGTTFDPPNSSNTNVAGITYSGEIFGEFTDEENRQHGLQRNLSRYRRVPGFRHQPFGRHRQWCDLRLLCHRWHRDFRFP